MKIREAIQGQIDTLNRSAGNWGEAVSELKEVLHHGEDVQIQPYAANPVVRDLVEAFLKSGQKVEMSQCYENSAALAKFDDGILYIEGHALALDHLLEHAWNCYDGDFYFDLTAELALKRELNGYIAVRFMDGIQL